MCLCVCCVYVGAGWVEKMTSDPFGIGVAGVVGFLAQLLGCKSLRYLSSSKSRKLFMCSKNKTIHRESDWGVTGSICWHCVTSPLGVQSAHVALLQGSWVTQDGGTLPETAWIFTFRYELCCSRSFCDFHIQWQHPVWDPKPQFKTQQLRHRLVNIVKHFEPILTVSVPYIRQKWPGLHLVITS